jgi:NTE family protein
MRGAYQVGVLAGIIEALGLKRGDRAPFDIFVGTSVGAINAAYLAAHADRGDLGIHGLVDIWRGLKLREMLVPELFGWWRPVARRLQGGARQRSAFPGQSLLDPTPLNRLVCDAVPWDRLHRNVDEGRVQALVIPALNVLAGQTWVFAELSPGRDFRPSKDPNRRAVPTRLGVDHVMASAAIPAIFPPRRIDGRYFYDGGLRFNTPIAPAIRIGASRLVVITPLKQTPDPVQVHESQPELGFLTGKLLNAVLLDPVAYDLQVLERLNKLWETLEEVVDPQELARVKRVLVETRGQAYRKLGLLSFQPTADLGAIAVGHLRDNLDHWDLGPGLRWALRRAVGGPEVKVEADWTSFVLFEGSLAERLIVVGRKEALERAEQIRAFFGPC